MKSTLPVYTLRAMRRMISACEKITPVVLSIDSLLMSKHEEIDRRLEMMP